MRWWQVMEAVYGWEWLRTLLRTVYHLIRRGVIPFEAVVYAAVTFVCVLAWMGMDGVLVLVMRHLRTRLVQSEQIMPATTVSLVLWRRRVVFGIDWVYWLNQCDHSWGYVLWCAMRHYVQVLALYMVIAWWW